MASGAPQQPGRRERNPQALSPACPVRCIRPTDIVYTVWPSMAHDPSANLQIFSPTGSGRSSPSPRVTRNHAEDGTSGAPMPAATVYASLLKLDSTAKEGQRLSSLCSGCRARTCTVGHGPAGMGRLHIVLGKALEGQYVHLVCGGIALMSLCSGSASSSF